MINPATPVETLAEVLDIVDYVLVMSVNPGFGGQKFIPGTLHKMRKLAEIRAARGYSYRIEVDGGVGMDTVAQVVQAGAEILVAGNAVFGKGDAKANAEALMEAARSGKFAEGLERIHHGDTESRRNYIVRFSRVTPCLCGEKILRSHYASKF